MLENNLSGVYELGERKKFKTILFCRICGGLYVLLLLNQSYNKWLKSCILCLRILLASFVRLYKVLYIQVSMKLIEKKKNFDEELYTVPYIITLPLQTITHY